MVHTVLNVTLLLFYSYISLHSLMAKPKCILDCRQRLLPEFGMFSQWRVLSEGAFSHSHLVGWFPIVAFVCSSYPPCSRWTTWTSWLQGGWAEDCVHSDRRKLPMCLPKLQAYPMATVWIIKVALALQAPDIDSRWAWYHEKLLDS